MEENVMDAIELNNGVAYVKELVYRKVNLLINGPTGRFVKINLTFDDCELLIKLIKSVLKED